MANFRWLASFVLAGTAVPVLVAKTHCPGNVESVPFRLVNRYQIIVPVSINHTGPYNFLLDTGTQMTMLDPSLVARVHIDTDGTAVVASVGKSASASYAQVDTIDVGSHSWVNHKVLEYDLKNLQATDLNIQGVLGEDFLEQFDLLIDNEHHLLCLEDTGVMRSEMRGEHIPLVMAPQSARGVAMPNMLFILASLSDGTRPVRLKLDSGASVSFLYNPSQYMARLPFRNTSLYGGGDGSQRIFLELPPQRVEIGSLELPQVSFVTLAGVQKDSHNSDFDGLLTLQIFKRVFICHAGQFAVLEPW
jgi:Aspartyl protease